MVDFQSKGHPLCLLLPEVDRPSRLCLRRFGNLLSGGYLHQGMADVQVFRPYYFDLLNRFRILQKGWLMGSPDSRYMVPCIFAPGIDRSLQACYAVLLYGVQQRSRMENARAISRGITYQDVTMIARLLFWGRPSRKTQLASKLPKTPAQRRTSTKSLKFSSFSASIRAKVSSMAYIAAVGIYTTPRRPYFLHH